MVQFAVVALGDDFRGRESGGCQGLGLVEGEFAGLGQCPVERIDHSEFTPFGHDLQLAVDT